MLQSDKLQLTIINPDKEEILIEGVDALSSANLEGPFDIWPLHTNFISIIKDFVTVYKSNQKIKELKIETGILRVSSNKVEVFLGIEGLKSP